MRNGSEVQRTSFFNYDQSYVPSKNHFPLNLSCTKRYNTNPVPAVTAMSHSSRDQPSCSDQSPEERHGPAVQTMSPAISSRCRQHNRQGFASRRVTLALSGGRNRRSAITALICSRAFSAGLPFSSGASSSIWHGPPFSGIEIDIICFCFPACLTSLRDKDSADVDPNGAKCRTAKAPSRWGSSNSTDPTLPSPTIPAIRASVNSSFSGSGKIG